MQGSSRETTEGQQWKTFIQGIHKVLPISTTVQMEVVDVVASATSTLPVLPRNDIGIEGSTSIKVHQLLAPLLGWIER